MNILGVDFGKKRIGLAWVNTDVDVILAFGVISDFKELENIVITEKIDKIVFGLPFTIGGQENENTKKIKNLAKELQNKVKIEIDFIDESFTTAKAKKTDGDISLDEKSAMIILEDYLKK
jgi:putative Holliday junction resolvase